jgi:hypothetical protein
MATRGVRRGADPWIQRLARLGYASKGVVYGTIGYLTTSAGLRLGGMAADRRDAVAFIASQSLGRALLYVVALGLMGYALWRVLSGVTDSELQGSDLKGIAIRIGYVVRGLFYGSFAVVVVRLLLYKGGPGQSSDTTSRHWTARAFDHPGGRWIVTIAGLTLIGYGIYECWLAVRGMVSKRLDFSGMTKTTRETLVALSCFGIAARAMIFGVIGVSLIRAAWHHSAATARGSSGALRQIGALPMGRWILTGVGLGLISYGLYAFINARYRRIRPA